MHLKRLSAPRSWHIFRKSGKFIIRPLPSGFSKSECMPLLVLCIDVLKMIKTSREAKKVISSGALLVDGTARKNPKYCVGFMDIVTVNPLKKAFRVTKTTKGRISLVEIPKKEEAIKVCKVRRKMIVKAGKTQICTHDGNNFILDKKMSKAVDVGSSVVVQLPERKIISQLPMEKGMTVFVTSGRHVGEMASIKDIKGDRVVLQTKDTTYETLKDYSFVVGKTKSEVTLL